MKSIKAEGVPFKYIFANEVIDEKDTLFIRTNFLGNRNYPWKICKELQDGLNTRLAFFKRPVPQKEPGPYRMWNDLPYCLVWPNDKIDLNMLDKKVMSDCFSDQDFYDSIRTRIHRLKCYNCHNEYITLVAEYGDIYFAEDEDGNLDRLKTDLLKNKFSDLKIQRCPNCNYSFTMPTIKILSKYTEDC